MLMRVALATLIVLLCGCTEDDKQRPFNKYLYDHGVVK
jgi:hypothetical protein